MTLTGAEHVSGMPRQRRTIERDKHERWNSAQESSKAGSSNPSQEPSCHVAMWTMENRGTRRRDAETSR